MREPPADAQAATQPESVLVALARQGDLDAFDQLVAAHQSRIYNLCLWIIGDRDDAADAAQDAFIRAFRFLSKFRGDAAFGTWVGRIAVNVARDAAAKRKRAPKSLTNGNPETGEEPDERRELAAEDASPAEILLRRERQLAVRKALAGLHENHRVVLVLFEIQGFAYEDVAHILQLPVGTVKSRINRARQALRQALEKQRELFDA